MKKMIIKGCLVALLAQGLLTATVFAAPQICTGCEKIGDVWYCDDCKS